jgi:hypothetical protein
VGADLSDTTSTQLFAPANAAAVSNYSTAGIDWNLLFGGYVKDPKFIPFNINYSGEHASNAVALGGYRDNVYDFGFNTAFLPDRPFPLHIFYQKSEYGANGTGFGENSDTSSFGLTWALLLKHWPKVNLRYLKQDNQLQLVTSVTNSSYRLSELGIDASDEWKSWKWTAGFNDFSTASNAVTAVSLSSPFQEAVKFQDLLATRTFWDDKARFSFMDRLEWQQESLQGQPAGQFTDAYASAQLQIQHTPKLSSNYNYTFTEITESNEPTLNGTASSSNISLVPIPAFTSNTFGGGVLYRLIPSVSIFQQVQGFFVTGAQGAGEAENSEMDSMSGASFARTWRGIEMGGTYTGHLQVLGTTLGNHPETFSNDVQGRVGWGDPGRLRLVASGVDTRDNIVDQLGGFSNTRSVRMEAESTGLRGWQLRGTAERVRLEYLSVSGDITSDNTNYGVQIQQRRLTLGGGRQTSAGAGALFPAVVTAETWLSNPLPLNELVGTPLLNRIAHTDTAAASLRLGARFDVMAEYNSERDQLATSEPSFRTMDVTARYRVGKVVVQFGAGSYRIENIAVPGPGQTGNLVNRVFLRVTRDFKLF